MRGWKGLLTAALGLTLLEVVVQPEASGRVSGVFSGVAKIVGHFLSPSLPAIPARTTAPANPVSSSTSSGAPKPSAPSGSISQAIGGFAGIAAAAGAANN